MYGQNTGVVGRILLKSLEEMSDLTLGRLIAEGLVYGNVIKLGDYLPCHRITSEISVLKVERYITYLLFLNHRIDNGISDIVKINSVCDEKIHDLGHAVADGNKFYLRPVNISQDRITQDADHVGNNQQKQNLSRNVFLFKPGIQQRYDTDQEKGRHNDKEYRMHEAVLSYDNCPSVLDIQRNILIEEVFLSYSQDRSI